MGHGQPPSLTQHAPFAPLPVAPLAYDSPFHPSFRRPGMLTAIGVLSVVLACLGGLANLYGIFATFGMMMMSSIPTMVAPMQTHTVATPAPPVISGGMVVVPENDGLPAAQRSVVTTTLNRMAPMTAPRARQFDELLAQAGRLIFPVAMNNPDPHVIEANINEHGLQPGAGGGMGPDYFVVGTGRVEVYDDHAIFRPDGSADYVSVSVPVAAANASANVNTTTGTSAVVSNGSISFTTTVNGVTKTTVRPTPFFAPKISTGAAAVVIGESVVSFLLAIFLLIAGIMVLNDSRRGGKMHWIYVWIKIPLVLISTIATFYLWSGWMNGFTSMGPGAPPPRFFSGIMAVSAAFGGLMALAYPVTLLFLLRSRTVKTYYAPVS